MPAPEYAHENAECIFVVCVNVKKVASVGPEVAWFLVLESPALYQSKILWFKNTVFLLHISPNIVLFQKHFKTFYYGRFQIKRKQNKVTSALFSLPSVNSLRHAALLVPSTPSSFSPHHMPCLERELGLEWCVCTPRCMQEGFECVAKVLTLFLFKKKCSIVIFGLKACWSCKWWQTWDVRCVPVQLF